MRGMCTAIAYVHEKEEDLLVIHPSLVFLYGYSHFGKTLGSYWEGGLRFDVS